MAGQRYIGQWPRLAPSKEASMLMFSVVVVGDVIGRKSMPEARRASHIMYQSCASRIAQGVTSTKGTSKIRSGLRLRSASSQLAPGGLRYTNPEACRCASATRSGR